MSPKINKAQSVGRVKTKRHFSLIWHSALKRGVVVSPLFPPPIFKIQEQKPQKKTAEKMAVFLAENLKGGMKVKLLVALISVGIGFALGILEDKIFKNK